LLHTIQVALIAELGLALGYKSRKIEIHWSSWWIFFVNGMLGSKRNEIDAGVRGV
jgi:hypothetical protein